MGLEKVKDDILDSSIREADKLKDDSKIEAKKIIEAAEKQIKVYRTETIEEIKKVLQSMKSKEIASSELELKKFGLESKKIIIEKVFNDAKHKIEKLSETKNTKIISRLLDKAKNEIDISVIYCNKEDSNLFKEYKIKEEKIIGGFIAENGDGNIRVDYSFDTILSQLRENYLLDSAKLLFEKNVKEK